MADHDREFGSNLPVVTDIAGQWTGEADNFKDDIEQRLTLDHYMDGVLTEGAADQDGRHKQVTMKSKTSDPTLLADTGIVYTKDVDDITELFYLDNSGNAIQITEDGETKGFTVSNDLSEIMDEVASVSGSVGAAANTTSYYDTVVSYPSGFTKSNSIVLSSRIYNVGNNCYEEINGYVDGPIGTAIIEGSLVLFGDSNITIRSSFYNNNQSFLIVLGKLI